MNKPLLLPRLGSPRVDHGLVEEVRRIRTRSGHGEGFYTSRGRKTQVHHQPDDYFYVRMMAAKGCPVKIGAL